MISQFYSKSYSQNEITASGTGRLGNGVVLDKAVVVGLEAQEHAALAAAKDTAQLAALQPAAPGELDHRLRPVVDHVQPDGILRLGGSDVEQRRPPSGQGQWLREILPVHQRRGN